MTLDLTPAERAWLDQEDRHTAAVIREHRTYIQYVAGDSGARRPSFAYTVGLFGLDHPEVLVFGLSMQTAGALLNEVRDRVLDGDDLVVGATLAFDAWPHRVRVEHVPNPGRIAFAANRFYQRPSEASVPMFQLTYDDKAGRFPGEPGYANAGWIQPRPGEFTA